MVQNFSSPNREDCVLVDTASSVYPNSSIEYYNDVNNELLASYSIRVSLLGLPPPPAGGPPKHSVSARLAPRELMKLGWPGLPCPLLHGWVRRCQRPRLSLNRILRRVSLVSMLSCIYGIYRLSLAQLCIYYTNSWANQVIDARSG